MRKILSLIVTVLLLHSCKGKKTDLVLLGTVHESIQHFTPDSLYGLLVKLNPDLILYEVDSTFFTKTFEFNQTWESNENIATRKYKENYDVEIRPYDFTRRNEYRRRIGARPTDSKAYQLLDSLYRNNKLDSLHMRTYEEFLKVSDSLNSFAYLGARAFNNAKTDEVAQLRQSYQYKALMNIMNKYPIFSNTFFVNILGDSISYAEGFEKAGEFWDLRNRTMAKNILHFVKECEGCKIVVLNGYYHRYYLKALIKPKEDELNFSLREFYEY